MSQRKRSVDDDEQLVDENNNNKKFKPTKSVFSKSHFESVSNEVISEIFGYLDIYDVYHSFFNYNNRFRDLILNSNLFIQIHVPNIPKKDFTTYCFDMIYPNKNRINYLHLSNPFTFNELFSLPSSIYYYPRLETLILKDTNIKFLSVSFQILAKLNHLHTLKISFANTVESAEDIYRYIFKLPHLITLDLTYRTKHDYPPSPINFSLCEESSIENLTINARFRFDSVSDLLAYVPNLRYLSMNSLVGNNLSVLDPSIIVLQDLKHVSVKLDGLSFLQIYLLAEMYFESVEHFNVTIRNSETMASSNYWKGLIRECLPNLKQFDLNIRDNINQNADVLNEIVHSYREPFWTMRKSFFSHQQYYLNTYQHHIMLHSTNPYRRKDFSLYWNTCQINDHGYCEHKSVEYLKIYGEEAFDVPYYLPNVNRLKLVHYFKTSNTNRSFIDTLERLFPLKQLKILEIRDRNMPFDELINLIYSLPKLHTVKLGNLLIYQLNLSLIEQHPVIQSIMQTNQVKTFQLITPCSLQTLKFILKLFPNIEHLTIGTEKKDIFKILHELFRTKNRRLKSLCFTETPQRYVKEVDFYLQTRDLLTDYSIKLCNRQLFLWW